MTYALDMRKSDVMLMIFSGNFLWRLYPFERSFDPYYNLLAPKFRYIDSAFMDTKTSEVIAIKGEDLIYLGDKYNINAIFNRTLNHIIHKVSVIIPGIKDNVNAITFDDKLNELHLFTVRKNML